MNELDELREEILENTDLDINEKMCLIALLCGGGTGGEREIGRLMGATVQTARLALESLKKKGYLSYPPSPESARFRGEQAYRQDSFAHSRDLDQDYGYEDRDLERNSVRDRSYDSSRDHDRDRGYDHENVFEEGSFADLPRDAESKRLANYLLNDEKKVEVSGLIKKGSTRASIAQQRYAKSTSQRSEREKEALEQLEKAREFFSNRRSERNVDDRQGQRPQRGIPEMEEQDAVTALVEDDFSTFQRNALQGSYSENTTRRTERKAAEEQPTADIRRTYAKSAGSVGTTKEKALKSSAMREITEEKVQKVMHLMDEALTRPEATIILGFAGGDYEKVERVYERVRRTQIKDKVDALVKLLQSEESSQ